MRDGRFFSGSPFSSASGAILGLLAPLALASFQPAAPASEPRPMRSRKEWRRDFTDRRARVLEALSREAGDRGVLLLRAPKPARFSNDVHYLYRPDNNLYYLSGLADDGIALLLSVKPLPELGREILVLRPVGHMEALWNGKRLDAREASAISGIPESSIVEPERLEEILRSALPRPRWNPHHRSPSRQAAPILFYDAGGESGPGEPLTEGYQFLVKTLGSGAFGIELRRPRSLVHPLRQVKSRAEIAMIQSAIDATCKAHRNAMELARAGLFEYHLAAEIEATFRRQGCRGWAFPSIIGSGPNSCVLHYMRYERKLEDGDLVVMDIGGEYGFYAADVTRTIPVSGRFTERQKQIYRIVLEAQEAALGVIRPGLPHRKVHETAREAIADGLIRIGLIDRREAARRYFPHGTSHGLGLDVHDPMPLPTLEVGMVFTVEPGIYIPEENLGVRIEDDVVVTEKGYRILSLDAPRSIEEIERLMSSRTF